MKANIEALIARPCPQGGASHINEWPFRRNAERNQHNLEETDMSYSTSSGAGQQRETSGIIAASKVNGTKVYNKAGEALGSIYDVMLDKQSGQVVYAVMSFGGFLGIGEKYHPLPWDQLTYSTVQDGYVVDLDKRILESAPSYGVSDTPDWSSPAYRTGIDEYYHTRH
jgi:sporulation protein YlmC with PRC-barrel domain